MFTQTSVSALVDDEHQTWHREALVSRVPFALEKILE